jgi:hypothetical protein
VTWVMWNLIVVRLEKMFLLVQDRCAVCDKCTTGLEIGLDAPMVCLGDKAQMEACFGPFGHSANLDIRYVHGLCRMYHRLINYFRRTRWNS